MTFGQREGALTDWIARNAAVTWVEVGRPWEIESQLIRELALPLNIDSNAQHPFYAELRGLRRQARLRARQMLTTAGDPMSSARSTIVQPPGGQVMTSPIEKALTASWREFKRYAETEMGYTNAQNRNECLNGAGAFVDFLLGRSPQKGTRYASSTEWPTS
jgi:hypothetical protein